MSAAVRLPLGLPVLPSTLDTTGQSATLGVLGGGQLGRMFVHAAQRLGYATAVLDPDPHSPAGCVSHHHIQADYQDAQALSALGRLCSAITTEFENVPAQSLRSLADHCPVAPQAAVVAIAQDRRQEKMHFTASAQEAAEDGQLHPARRVACAPYALIESAEQLQAVPDNLLPGILKTACLGYDGKGQAQVADRAALASAWQDLGQVRCVLEKRLPLRAECSVIIARGWDGQMVHFAPQRNVHVNGILAVTAAYPENLPAAIAESALDATKSIANHLNYVGVLCVEFFVLPEGQLVVNEMAPRPHNSGHYTLDACDVSQFDLQVHTMAGLPLPMPRQHLPAIMLNLLGEVWFDALGQAQTPDWPAVLALPGAQLHLYGKTEPRKGRKMGHLTLTGPSVAEVLATARQAAAILRLPGLDALEAFDVIQSGSDPAVIDQAAQRIRAGGLVSFPTETVYGLGADARQDEAVARIFAAKGRPSEHPLIVHLADAGQVPQYARAVPDFATRLMAAFWPGPLTLILPRQAGVATAAAGGQDSIGLRCPAHPVTLAFLQACQTGVAGPSANRFGRISPTTAQHVTQEFASLGADDLLVLDGGPCQVGIESSIIDCTRGHPVLLRPGVLTLAQLSSACGQTVHHSAAEDLARDAAASQAPRAPGTLLAHYAPQAKLRLMDTQPLQTAINMLAAEQGATHSIAVYARSDLRIPTAWPQRRMPDDAVAAAQVLFGALRELDTQGVALMWVEEPPDTAEWDGVRDRLRRAAAS